MDEEENSFLYCISCDHNLNNCVYNILSHPILFNSPVCVICYDDIKTKLEDPHYLTDEICSWCLNEDCGEELVLCGDNNSTCKHVFCAFCLKKHLGEQKFSQIKLMDFWVCCACNPSQLQMFENALCYGQENSIYNKDWIYLHGDSINLENEDESMEVIVRGDIERLSIIVQNINESLSMIEQTKLDEKEAEIRQELTRRNTIASVSIQCREEMAIYIQFWKRDYDILLFQEALLFEKIQQYGYDPKALLADDYELSEIENTWTSTDQPVIHENQFERNQLNDDASTGSSQSFEDYIDNNDHINNMDINTFEKMATKANSDPIVSELTDKNDDLDPSQYPLSFNKVVPNKVLKAYFYARGDKSKALERDYNIPDYIKIVMKAINEPKVSSSKWLLNEEKCHPTVLKALNKCENIFDIATICDHFGLPKDLYHVSDMGDIEEVLGIGNGWNDRCKSKCFYSIVNGTKNSKKRVNYEQMQEALEMEDERMNNMRSKFSEKKQRRYQSIVQENADNDDENHLSNELQSDYKKTVRSRKSSSKKCSTNTYNHNNNSYNNSNTNNNFSSNRQSSNDSSSSQSLSQRSPILSGLAEYKNHNPSTDVNIQNQNQNTHSSSIISKPYHEIIVVDDDDDDEIECLNDSRDTPENNIFQAQQYIRTVEKRDKHDKIKTMNNNNNNNGNSDNNIKRNQSVLYKDNQNESNVNIDVDFDVDSPDMNDDDESIINNNVNHTRLTKNSSSHTTPKSIKLTNEMNTSINNNNHTTINNNVKSKTTTTTTNNNNNAQKSSTRKVVMHDFFKTKSKIHHNTSFDQEDLEKEMATLFDSDELAKSVQETEAAKNEKRNSFKFFKNDGTNAFAINNKRPEDEPAINLVQDLVTKLKPHQDLIKLPSWGPPPLSPSNLFLCGVYIMFFIPIILYNGPYLRLMHEPLNQNASNKINNDNIDDEENEYNNDMLINEQ
eukprot:gene14400-19331_t